MKILVCEDDEAILKIIQFKLKKELNAEVHVARDGKEALEGLHKGHDFNLIISDIHMPYHSGMELIEQVRNENNDPTPIIILSAEGLEDTLEEAFNLGANDFLTKPFSPQELVSRVKRVLK